MSAQDDAIVEEFLADSQEGLDRLDQDLVALEAYPCAAESLASAFRALHTIKGTCSFLGFRRLERIAHAGEHLLARLRSRERVLDAPTMAALLACVDAVRAIVTHIQATRREPGGDDDALIASITALHHAPAAPVPAAAQLTAAPETPAMPELRESHAAGPNQTRIHTEVLDRVVDLVGELVLARNQLRQCVEHRDEPLLLATARRLDHITSRLQEEAMRTRMQPVAGLWTRIPRLVRDVATACGKDVHLQMSGQHTELDRTLLEALRDPLVHLVRNAIDHGIETPAARIAAGKSAHGTLQLHAHHEGGEVHLEVRDDGAGLALERIRARAVERGLLSSAAAAALDARGCVDLIFHPGFSTAERVTHVSGRGVGMDVVQAGVESLGGRIDVHSDAGRGAAFCIHIPLTLAILPALIVEERGERYAMPQAHLLELVRASASELPGRLEWIHDTPVYRLRGQLLPVVPLASALHGVPAREAVLARGALLVLRAAGRTFALLVNHVLDTEEIVVKPLSPRLRGLALFAGATVRGDGRIALILDAVALAARAGLTAVPDDPGAPALPPAAASTHAWLCVTTLAGAPAALALAGVTRIEEAAGAAFETPGGSLVLRWRDRVLPVRVLGQDAPRVALDPAHMYAILIVTDPASLACTGVLVHSLDDILESPAGAAGGSHIVLRGRVHVVHDLHAHPLVEAA